jgi:hypothetical protein
MSPFPISKMYLVIALPLPASDFNPSKVIKHGDVQFSSESLSLASGVLSSSAEALNEIKAKNRMNNLMRSSLKYYLILSPIG